MTHKPIRRVLALLIACSMTFGLLAVSASAETATGPELKLVNTTEGTLKKGDTFQVAVKITDADYAFSNFRFFLIFDDQALKLTEIITSYTDSEGDETDFFPNLTSNLDSFSEGNTTYQGAVVAANATNKKTKKQTLFIMKFTALTCTENSTVNAYCAEFGRVNDNGNVDIVVPTITPAAITIAHTLTAVSAKAATCTENGNSAYWTCSGCNTWFSDAEGKSIIEDHSSVTIAAGHKTSEEWTPDDNGHWHKCENCETKVDYAAHSGGTATCTQQAICTVCQQLYGSTADHSYVTQHDDTQHWQHCTVCQQDTDKTSHTYGEWQTVTAATCHSKGEKKHTCTFVGCGQTEAAEIEMTDHRWGEWTEQNGQMVRKCQNTGCNETETMSIVTVTFTKKNDGAYNGSAQLLSDFVNAATVDGGSENITYWMDGQQVQLDSTTVTNAGTYTVKAVYQDNETKQYGTAEVKFKIDPKTVNVSGWTWDYSTAFTYDGNAKTVKLTTSDLTGVSVTYEDNEKTDAGTYTTKATVKAANDNYQVIGSINDLHWEIKQAPVTVPEAAQGLKYTGQTQTGVAAASELYTVTGGTGKDADTYNATASLKDKRNYCWSDTSDSGDKTISWSIGQADALALTDSKSLLYSNAAEQAIVVSDVTDVAGAVLTGVTTSDNNSILAKAELKVGAVTYALKSDLTKSDATKTALLTITFTSKNYQNSTYTLTITVNDKADVSSRISFENGQATYNGKKQTYEAAKLDGQTSDKFTYTYSADPIQMSTYSVTATYEDAASYGTKTASFQILPAPLTIDSATVTAKEYDGTSGAEGLVSNVKFSGLIGDDTVQYTVTSASFADANAGEKLVTFVVALDSSEKNYSLGDKTTGKVLGTINQKPVAVTVSDIKGSFPYTGSAQAPGVTVSATDTVGGYELVKDTDYTVSYTGNTNAGEATVTVSAKSGSNYRFSAVAKYFTIEKASPNVSAENLTVVYTGNVLAANSIKGAATFQGHSISGTWSWVTAPSNVTVGSYEVRVCFIPHDTDNLIPVERDITVIIIKAAPVGEPAYTAIEQSGKTLADAKLGLGTLPAGGTIVWVDSDSNVLPDTTTVEENKAYTWRYTPADLVNYTELTGSVTLYAYQYIPVIPVAPSTPSKPSESSQPEETEQPDATEPEEPTATADFSDVSEEDWFADSVEYVCENGLMNGTGDGQFEPYANTTRGMIVTMLARLEGVDTNQGSSWYEAGRQWAMEMGISDGSNMTGEMTREQLATMLYRYAQSKGYDTTARADFGSFADAGSVSGWATEAMQWAVSMGLIQGSDNQLAPGAGATRAETAAILERFMHAVAKLDN